MKESDELTWRDGVTLLSIFIAAVFTLYTPSEELLFTGFTVVLLSFIALVVLDTDEIVTINRLPESGEDGKKPTEQYTNEFMSQIKSQDMVTEVQKTSDSIRIQLDEYRSEIPSEVCFQARSNGYQLHRPESSTYQTDTLIARPNL